MNKYLMERLIESVGIYYSITNTLGYHYSNIPSDFDKSKILVRYNDKYYDKKIGFVDIAGVRYEITVYNDVTDIKKQSMYDAKTGALTFEWFKKKLSDELSKGSNIVLGLIDIDDFKGFNDTFGHHVGDLVLAKVVESLSCYLGENAIICRFGGDEFLVAVKNSDVDSVRYSLDKYATDIKTNLCVDDNICLMITFSIGITNYNNNEDFATNFDRVDDTMYYCKKHGKNGVVSKEVRVKVLENKKHF